MTGRPQGPAIRRDCACGKVRHEHGTLGAYQRDRCRCHPCRAGMAAYTASRRRSVLYGRWDKGRQSSVGSARRLQALAACGWSMAAIGRASGIDSAQLRALARGDHPLVLPRTARMITGVYDRLWNAPPTGTANALSKTREWARRNGWVPPLAWNDEDLDVPSARPFRPRPRVAVAA